MSPDPRASSSDPGVGSASSPMLSREWQPRGSLRLLRPAAWLLLLPGISQLVLLCVAMFGRLRFPYDLEWMEGGILIHAQRIADGAGIYVEPSVDFIPFLYTPLYPGILAMFGDVIGISYAAGRSISVLATLGIVALLFAIVRRESRRDTHQIAWLGGACAAGFFAATYPWVEGWYDLVRADSLFMLMVVGGLFGVRSWARERGQTGLAKLGVAATLLGLSFFAKQTGVLFVGAGGLMLLLLNWRRVPLYVAVTGTIGLGGTWLLNKVTQGWFWVYVYKTHQHHDFNMDRFYKSFGYILWKFPWMTIVILLALVVVLATLVRLRMQKRDLPIRSLVPDEARAFLIWLPVFVIAVFVGAVGWGTQFAHFNAYVPAMVFGSLCAGLSVSAIAACAPAWRRERWLPFALGTSLAMLLGLQLVWAWWHPLTFVPSDSDERAGHELVRTIAASEGPVFMPYHPWYTKLAGKEPYVHLMGLRDMTTGKVWPIRGLREALSEQHFSMVVMDNRPLGRELSQLQRHYRMDDFLPSTSSPHVYTGAGAVWNRKVQTLIPKSIWLPNAPLTPPEGTRVLWNFEDGRMGGFESKSRRRRRKRDAWGRYPVSAPLPTQGPVRRYGGRYYLTSFHGGDEALGTLYSPSFVIDGSTIHFRVSGGNSEDLRVELRIEGEVVRSATGNDSERMEDVSWNVAAYAGKSAELVLIDEDKGGWGHLNVDEIWIQD